MTYILDACALFALIADEQGGDIVNGLLEKAESGDVTLCMSRINLLEVYYCHIRSLGLDRADEIVESVYASPIQVIGGIEEPVFREAAILKSRYRVSLADSVALAFAKALDYTIVTADHHEMDIVDQNEPINFLWVR